MSCFVFPSYSHHKTLEALKNNGSFFEWGSRGREFKSLHPDFSEASKINASEFFYAAVTSLRIVINRDKS